MQNEKIVPPVKRGRGRPPKIRFAEDSVPDSMSSGDVDDSLAVVAVEASPPIVVDPVPLASSLKPQASSPSSLLTDGEIHGRCTTEHDGVDARMASQLLRVSVGWLLGIAPELVSVRFLALAERTMRRRLPALRRSALRKVVEGDYPGGAPLLAVPVPAGFKKRCELLMRLEDVLETMCLEGEH